ncbi:hypothetical protein [Archangium sp.]|jgi:hypothetical protein|uniref:hypothetical protein n=1 Tax=Archangium sp. TaxID=1872627 RepID=UPI002ED7D1A8
MAHATDDGRSPLVVPQSSPSEETSSGESPSRPSRPRTPPRVWPPMSPGDMGRVVRRLKLSAQALRDSEPMVSLVGT